MLNLDTPWNKEQLNEHFFFFSVLSILHENERTIIHDTDKESLQNSDNSSGAATGASQADAFISGNEIFSQDSFFLMNYWTEYVNLIRLIVI